MISNIKDYTSFYVPTQGHAHIFSKGVHMHIQYPAHQGEACHVTKIGEEMLSTFNVFIWDIQPGIQDARYKCIVVAQRRNRFTLLAL